MLKITVSGITLTLLLTSMLTMAFNVAPVTADPEGLLLIETDKYVYDLSEPVHITLTNIGDEYVEIGGMPSCGIYTYPDLEDVWPSAYATLYWGLAPGQSETWSAGALERGVYVVRFFGVLYTPSEVNVAFFGVSVPLQAVPPVANFTWSPSMPKVGESVTFDASSSLSGWNGTEYRWNFGDGNKTTTSTPTVYHSFGSSGIYYVTLTVYALGATPETDTISHKVTIISVPVGGYSIPIKGYTTTKPLTLYLALVAILTASFTIAKRRKKQQN